MHYYEQAIGLKSRQHIMDQWLEFEIRWFKLLLFQLVLFQLSVKECPMP